MIWLVLRAVVLAVLSVPVGATMLVFFMRLVPGEWTVLRPAAAACAKAAPIAAGLVAVAVLPDLPDAGDGFRAAWLAPAWFVARTVAILVAIVVSGRLAARGKVSTALAVAGLVALPLLGSFAAFDWIQATYPDYHSAQFGLNFVAHLWLGGVAAALLLTLRHGDTPTAAAVGVFVASLMLWAYFWAMAYIVAWSASLPDEARWWLARQTGVWGLVLAALAIGQFVLPFGLMLSPRARSSRRVVGAVCAVTLAGRVAEMMWLLVP